ncbi:MAG TPA: hypothetical protein VMO26_22130 [Vicinamibacterales bacterium]|nr:hypothetical protein [Vicinamibacterales bacterium]
MFDLTALRLHDRAGLLKRDTTVRIKRAMAGLSSAELRSISADNGNESVSSRTRNSSQIKIAPV